MATLDRLKEQLTAGRIDRRQFLARAVGLGLSLSAASALLAARSQPALSATAAGEGGAVVPTLEFAHYSADFSPTFVAIARILAEDFKKIGFDIQLKPMNFNTFVSQITVGGQINDMALLSWGADPDRLDPNHWLGDLNTCGARRNAGHWCDPEWDKMFSAQRVELDESKRRALVVKMAAYHNERLPQWPVTHNADFMLYNSQKFGNFSNPTPIQVNDARKEPWLSITPKTDDTILDIGAPEDVSTWNVLAETASFGWLRQVYQTFLRDDGSKLGDWAATEWKVVDPTTIELKLRDGAKFHDGREVTAKDAVFTFDYLLKWKPPTYQVAMQNVKGAKAVDKLTLRVMLQQPDAAFFRKTLTFVPVLPEHIWSQVPKQVGVTTPMQWDPRPDKVIGSGPFVFDHWNKDQEHFLKRFEGFYQPPKVAGLRKVIFSSSDAMVAAMQQGQIDFTTDLIAGAKAADLAKQHKHLTFVNIPTHSTQCVVVNHKKPLFQDPAIRQALRLATNKERINQEALLGYGTVPGEGPVPIVMDFWYDKNLKKWAYNLDQAKQVLKKAGYGWARDGRLQLPPNGPNIPTDASMR
jgi:peptide/nickel transport system substrate-binding protein